MRKNYLISILIVLLAVAFLAAAAWRMGPVNNLRKQYNLETIDPIGDSQISAELRIPTIALFTFRSLAIDYLWIRADELKNDGQYFDALHLSRMICALLPNVDTVWIFQAWNMAYNISVAVPTAPERWEWVKAGFELLRDQGLAYNPDSLKLHRELAWIFQHKIGGITDDHHGYYKWRLASEMTPLLSPFYSSSFSQGSSQDIAQLVQAPRSWDELADLPEMIELVDKIKKAQPTFIEDKDMFQGLIFLRVNPTGYAPALHQLIADNRYNPALKKLDYFIRARVFREEWKMDPQLMLRLNNKYGPIDIDYENEDRHFSLDWRSSFVHALYWAQRALEFAPGKLDYDELNLHRIIYHNLQNIYHYGNLQILTFMSPPTQTQRQQGQEVLDKPRDLQLQVFNSQDLRMFPIAYQATLDLMKSYTDIGEEEPSGVVGGSTNLARSGLVNLYLAGHRKLPQKYLNHLAKRYPDNDDYKMPLEQFVRKMMKEELLDISRKNAPNYIINFLRDGYGRYARGDDENAVVQLERAKEVRDIFEKDYPDIEDPTARLKIRSFDELKWVALMDLFNDPMIHQNLKGLLLTKLEIIDSKLYNRVKVEIKKQRQNTLDTELTE